MADILQGPPIGPSGGSIGAECMSIGTGGVVLFEKIAQRPLEAEQEELWKAGSPVQMHCPLCGEDAACVETQDYGMSCGPCWLDRKYAGV